MLKWIFKLFSKKQSPQQTMSKSPYSAVKVGYDEVQAWAHWPSKERQSLDWSSLIGVAIETTNEGPFNEDVWWHLASKEKVITFPSEASGAKEMLVRLQQIPTFNNERVIEAMSCTENRTFIVWDHEGRHQ